jgi:hypothetical protein
MIWINQFWFDDSAFPRRSTIIMRLISVVSAALLVGCVATTPGARSDEPRLDGSSEASFDSSFAKVVRPLSAKDRRQLALALFGVLLAEKCLSSNAILELTFLPVSTDRPADLHTCRTQLKGMSYRDIIDADKEKERGSHTSAT